VRSAQENKKSPPSSTRYFLLVAPNYLVRAAYSRLARRVCAGVIAARPFGAETTGRTLLPAAGCLLLTWCAAWPVSSVQAQDEVPAESVEFARIVTRARITRRFEIYNPRSASDLHAVKQMGFTQVMLDRAHLHAEASALGLDVVLANWWTRDHRWEQVQQGVALARAVDPKHLAAISMMDEPERYAPQTSFLHYRSLYERLRRQLDAELPAVRLEISHWGPLSNWTPETYERFVPLYRAADRMRLMPYPDLDERPLRDVYDMMLRSRNLMEMAGRVLPQVVILQTWALPNEPKLPTIDELRVMAYQAMLAGADALSFYNYDPDLWQQTPGFSQRFANLMRELNEFSNRFERSSVETTMSERGILRSVIADPDGDVSTVTVNTNRWAVEGLAGLAVVLHAPTTSPDVVGSARPSSSRDRQGGWRARPPSSGRQCRWRLRWLGRQR
jgi:hypothetical protein